MSPVPDLHDRKVLSLNCQKGAQSQLRAFLHAVLVRAEYDFILLQEANDVVVAMLDEQPSDYRIVRRMNEATNDWAHQIILYRSQYTHVDAVHHSFHPFYPGVIPSFTGVIIAEFSTPEDGMIAVASAHLHSGLKPHIRRREIRFLRDELSRRGKRMPVVFGGDMNNGFPREKDLHDRDLEPHFINMTHAARKTLDSRYSELNVNLINCTSVLLSTFGVGIAIKVDHIYTCHHIASKFVSHARTLPDRVSDHSPIELHLLARSHNDRKNVSVVA